MRTKTPAVVFLVITALALFVFCVASRDTRSNVLQYAEKSGIIVLDRPVIGQVVSSPLTIAGIARGGWFFEATFPVRLVDANGKTIAVHYAEARGNWMTNDFVSFRLVLNFADSDTDTGFLILEKSNPSGLSRHADELRIPVRFR